VFQFAIGREDERKFLLVVRDFCRGTPVEEGKYALSVFEGCLVQNLCILDRKSVV
jgi:hypothetical protein